MKIQWLGHSAFKLTESTGTSIITDPYSDEIGIHFPSVQADAVTLSHAHYDHNAFSSIAGNPVIIDQVGVHDYKGVSISSIRTYHDANSGLQRGKNLVFKFQLDGVEVCHLGDLGEQCNTRLVELLMPVNVLLIPVGGEYTIDAEEAKEYVENLMPDVVIPMHFKTKNLNIELDKVDQFVKLFDDDQIEYIDGDTVEFNRDDFDGEKTKIIIFDQQFD